jgi:O-antigen ligase
MASGPFLLPFHTQPITAFWSEWWAGALGLGAGIALLATCGRSLSLPRLLAIPGVLLVVVLVQFSLGRLVFPQVGLLYSTYLLWAGLLLAAGRYLVETVGLPRMAGVVASAFAAGALAGSAIALAQWLGASSGFGWIFPLQGGGIYANLGQPNHHAHYSWLGIASLFYLRGRGWLTRPVLWLAILPLALGSVISGSRSVFLYPLVLVLGVVWTRRRDPRGATALLLADALALLPVVIGLAVFGSWVSAYLPGSATTSATRLYDSVSGPSVRLALARTAWAVFLEHPWVGQGAGDFSWASFLAAAARTGDEPFQVAEHAHNLLLQGLAEFGAPATVVVAVLLVVWGRRFVTLPWALEEFWVAAILGIGAVHALLEYPLWYSYFLGPSALLLGATDGGKALVLPGRRARPYLALIGAAGILILANLRADYAAIEAASYQPLATHPDRERAWRISMENLQKLHRDSLLSPWALLAFAELAEPSREQADARVALCEKGIRFAPARSLLTRCAMQLAIAGRSADARRLVDATLRAFPGARETTIEELATGGQTHPEVLPLWRASLGK